MLDNHRITRRDFIKGVGAFGLSLAIPSKADLEERVKDHSPEKLLKEANSYRKEQKAYPWNISGAYPGEGRDFRKAISIYAKVMRDFPDSEQAKESLFGIALCYIGMAQLENIYNYFITATNRLRRFIEKNPEHPLTPRAELHLANVYGLDKEDTGVALPIYKNTIQKRHNTLFAIEALVRSTYIRYKEWSERESRIIPSNQVLTPSDAIGIYQEIINEPIIQDPETGPDLHLNIKALAQFRIGDIQYWRGQRWLAINGFQSLVDRSEVVDHDLLAEAYLFIGRIREQQNKFDLALETYQRALDTAYNSEECGPKGRIITRIERIKTGKK